MRARWWLGAPVSLAMLGGAGWGGLRWEYHRPGSFSAQRTVIIAAGGMAQTAGALVQSGVVASRLRFEIAAALTARDGPIHAGEFAIPPAASLARVLAVLRFAAPVQHKLTIPEGLTAAQVSRLLAAADGLVGPVAVPEEGAVLPQTYAFARGNSAAELLARAQAAMRRTIAAAWQSREAGLPLADSDEAVILASLVEKETAIPAERPRIAAVFINRLRDHMRLQSDPTVLYAASGGLGVAERPISRSDLGSQGPYNTYAILGLPAGPICNPGFAAIEAVLHPAPDASLYFVADGTGGHAFAETLVAHVLNVERYRGKPADLPQGRPAQAIR